MYGQKKRKVSDKRMTNASKWRTIFIENVSIPADYNSSENTSSRGTDPEVMVYTEYRIVCN